MRKLVVFICAFLLVDSALAATQKRATTSLPSKIVRASDPPAVSTDGISMTSVSESKTLHLPKGTHSSLELAFASAQSVTPASSESHDFTILTPSVGYDLKDVADFNFQVPFVWDSFGNPSGGTSSQRVIGRPALSAQRTLLSNDQQLVSAHTTVRLPFYDASFGGAEFYRVWGFEAGAAIDHRLPETAVHLIGGAGMEFNTNRTESTSEMDITLSRHPILRTNVGAKYVLDRLAFGSQLRNAFGLGRGHITINIPTLNREFRGDVETTEIWQLEVFAEGKITDNGLLRASLAQSLKDVSGKRAEAVLQSADAKDGAETLGAVSYSQMF